jgi:hypothetical protein
VATNGPNGVPNNAPVTSSAEPQTTSSGTASTLTPPGLAVLPISRTAAARSPKNWIPYWHSTASKLSSPAAIAFAGHSRYSIGAHPGSAGTGLAARRGAADFYPERSSGTPVLKMGQQISVRHAASSAVSCRPTR